MDGAQKNIYLFNFYSCRCKLLQGRNQDLDSSEAKLIRENNFSKLSYTIWSCIKIIDNIFNISPRS